MSRLCYECLNMRVEEEEGGWSEYTPGSDFKMWCYKQHWEWYAYTTSRRNLRDILVTADTCPDYKADPEMVKIGGSNER